jgi:periplasmic protein CpxP/Spy
MNYPSIRLALVAGLVLPFSLATASFAQDAPPAPPPGGPAADGMHHHHDPAQRRAHMADRLRAELQLQPGQDAALNAFIEAMKPPEGEHHMRGDHGQPDAMAHLTTPERLDKMMAKFDERRAHMTAHVAAVKQFYAQLSPAQQKAFDAMGPMTGRHHGDNEHGDHGFHHHDGGPNPTGAGGPPQG